MAASPLNVFVSYAQESPEHAQRVQRLVEQLRAQGFRCSYDQDPAWREEGWLEWMKQQIDRSHVVLMVCSSQYAKVEGGAGQPVRGRGSRFEYILLRDEVFSAGMRNKRIVPILLGGVSDEVIPAEFRDYTYFRPESEPGFRGLVEHLRLPRAAPGLFGFARVPGAAVRRRSHAVRWAVALGTVVVGAVLLIVLMQPRAVGTAPIEPPRGETQGEATVPEPAKPPGAPPPIEERPKPQLEERKPRPAPLHAEFRLGDGQARTFLGGKVTISVAYHQLGARALGTVYLNVLAQEPRKEPLAHAGPLLFELGGNRYSLTVLEDNEATRSASLELNELR